MNNDTILKRTAVISVSALAVLLFIAFLKNEGTEQIAISAPHTEEREQTALAAMEIETVNNESGSEETKWEEIKLPEISDKWVKYKKNSVTQEEKADKVLESMFGDDLQEVKKFAGDMSVIIRKPDGAGRFFVEENLVAKQLSISISGDFSESITPDSVYRINMDKAYNGANCDSESDFVKGMFMTTSEDGGETVIQIELKDYYCAEEHNRNGYCFITLRRPKDVYDKVVVLDAGHGGKDPGALACDKRTWEDELNLSILLKVKEMIDENPDIVAFCTRTGDTYPTLDDRVNLSNGVNADMFISVHCNSSENTNKYGTEVLCNISQGKDDALNSASLSKILAGNVSDELETQNRGLCPVEDIRIIRLSEAPAALVEIGYLSNKSDFDLISSEEGIEKAAKAIYNSILEAYEIKENDR